jgi:uncharacterized delta-60 repeat protein
MYHRIMRMKHAFVIGLLPFVSIFSCVGDSNNGNPDASDATNSDVTADNSIPTGATISVTALPTTWVAQNGQAQVPFTITRNGVTGTLTVHGSGLPSGVTAADATVADGQNNGTLTLAGSGAATLGATANVDIQLLDQTQLEDKKTIVVGVSGPPGSLDTTYGQNGSYSLSLTNRTIGYAMDVYPATAGADAGKIVVAGVEVNSNTDVRLIIARLLPTGQLDTTFGDFASGDAGARNGYVLFNPGASDITQISTNAVAVRIDSKGRIVLFNDRYISNVAPFCDSDITRWTASGDLDTTFTRFTGGISGFYCGFGADMRILPNDDVLALANWNIASGQEAVMQVFSAADGSKKGSELHVSLDTSCVASCQSTCTCQKSTMMNRVRVDKTGGYVLVGRQCDGGWSSSYPVTGCNPVVARVTPTGPLDNTFGQSSGFTIFTSFGTGISQAFYGEVIDPTTNDIVMSGTNSSGTIATLARVSSAGLPTTFGNGGSLTRDLLGGATSENLTSVSIDSATRIVAAGNAGTSSQTFVATTRASASGTADSTYGTGGTNATTPGAAEDAALGNDDRLYVTGFSGNRLVVWRFWP